MEQKMSEEFEYEFRKIMKQYKWLIIGLAKPAIIKPERIDAL
jgi:hypothetical protein